MAKSTFTGSALWMVKIPFTGCIAQRDAQHETSGCIPCIEAKVDRKSNQVCVFEAASVCGGIPKQRPTNHQTRAVQVLSLYATSILPLSYNNSGNPSMNCLAVLSKVDGLGKQHEWPIITALSDKSLLDKLRR
ncbi:hypothetical protein PCH_Pc18g06650 [Penicillium rubens Wisconsin 54-1255]|uniref:Uncharacterized protein n=1 Tax=Penicillium rubens (strain ATCC 28089 / DSM 1075 / NRRL 1951 / Wisconsin 54-1255) TaxID=500485 RepID=B6HCT7_PENRW|nr:hypothetical protein PCH_Pc18g06650 [Penicillium rubens Wisconsin 54-1255]